MKVRNRPRKNPPRSKIFSDPNRPLIDRALAMGVPMAQVGKRYGYSFDAISRYREQYAGKLQFDYSYDRKAGTPPFSVAAIYHDDKFTYIKCAAAEKPTLYEIKDDKPNLVNFELNNGVYVVPKILDKGYLAVGKKKFNFERHSQ